MLKPLSGNILIEIIEPTRKKSESGIILTESKSQFHAKVIAVGTGTEKNPVEVLPGDLVMVLKGGHKVESMGDKFKIVNHILILGVESE